MTQDRALLAALLDNIRDAVVIGDAECRLVRVNKAFEVLTGFDGPAFLKAEHGLPAQVKQRLSAAFAEATHGHWEGDLPHADGSEARVELSLTTVDGADLRLGVIRPAPEEGHAVQRFGYDILTGLPNRDIFMDRVDRAVLQVNRSGGSVALLMMGLDRFTLVNDALGHGAGDRLLIEVARRLKVCIRETDTAVRLEGDKFALVMTIASVDDSVIVAEKVLNAIKEPFAIDGQEVVVTFSIGIGIYPADANSPPALVKLSENALHHAKVSGRNQYQFFSSDMNDKAKRRLDLEARMRRALANDEFRVYYQPKVRASDNRVVGAEALVRWQDPDRGMISPGEFIPVAEETGMIEQIGEWVLRRSCEDNVRWQGMGLDPVRVSVNVSARQFKSRTLVERVVEILDDTGLDAKWLELEITESMLMNDIEQTVRKMSQLRVLGIGLSIDDFGTGYSSLSYLGRFPITTLKIDRAFIADVDTNPKTAEIARAIIGLSRGLNLEVVAEGAEVVAHVDFLREHGCHTVQGFFYSKPVPAEEFERMLRQGVLVSA
jgi:diguanylate cyclase (GGDEF)-like protein